jgi:hypothetical protein
MPTLKKIKSNNQCVKAIIYFLYASFIINFSSIASADLSADDLKLMNKERIFDYAIMGDAEAQYWTGNAIFKGLADSPKSGMEVEDWYKLAAQQGHKGAAKMFLKIAKYRDREDLVSEAIDIIHSLANMGGGSSEMHYTLSDYYWRYDRSKQVHHLKKAVDLGHAKAKGRLAIFLIYSDLISRDLLLAEKYLIEAASRPIENGEDYSEYKRSVCNTLYELKQIYSGEASYKENGKWIKDKSLKDDTKYLENLQTGSELRCLTSMHSLMDEYEKDGLLGYNGKKIIELASDIIAAESLSYSLAFTPIAGLSAIKAHVEDKNFEAALSFVKYVLPDQNWSKHLYDPTQNPSWGGRGVGSKLCAFSKVSEEDCHNYLNSLN